MVESAVRTSTSTESATASLAGVNALSAATWAGAADAPERGRPQFAVKSASARG
jgi:hypothetical protein